MKEELDALSKNHIWDLVILPLGNLWLVISGSTKSRLTLMGLLSDIRLVLLQKVLHKSMGLIMKRPLLRLLESHLFEPSAVAAASKWDFFQMDVKNVFLNRNLSEEVYMQPPPVSLLN